MRRLQLITAVLAVLASLAAAPAAGAASVVRHVHVNGISIGYRILGHGRPLVLIPGFAFTMFDWDPRFVSSLSARHRVVLFDNRGVATSTTRGRTITIGQMASDTAGLIRALRLRRPDVLGWSMGGYIAQDLALAHPNLLGRLVLASTDFGGHRAVKPSGRVIHELETINPQQHLVEFLKLLFPAKAVPAGEEWEGRIYAQAKRLGVVRYLGAAGKIIHEQLGAAKGWEHPGHGSYARLPRLRIPTLIAAGTQDVIVPRRNATMLLGRISGSTLLMYAGTGHAFLFQNPFPVAAQVNAFLG